MGKVAVKIRIAEAPLLETQFDRKGGKDALPKSVRANATIAAAMSAPSLRQYELDQVQRVTALRKPPSRISAPCRDTPGECVKLTGSVGPCQGLPSSTRWVESRLKK
jgi:hypothetical protein